MSEEEREHVVYKFEEGLEENNGCASEDEKKKSKLCYGLVLLVILAAIATITTGIVLLKPANRSKENTESLSAKKTDDLCAYSNDRKIKDLQEYCEQSKEAERIGLNTFLKKCQDFYFKTFRYEQLKHHADSPQNVKNFIARR